MTTSRPTRRGVTLTEVLVAMFVMALGMTALLTLFPLGAFQIGQALRDDRTAQTAMQADGTVRTFWRHHVVANGGLPPDAFVWGMDDANLFHKQPSPSHAAFRNTYIPPGFYLPSGQGIAPEASPSTVPVSGTDLLGDRNVPPPYASGSPPIPGHNPAVHRYVNNPAAAGGRTGDPSYPVLLDPIGFLARGASPEMFWVGRSSFAPAGPAPLLVPRRNFGSPAGVDPLAPNPNAAFAQGFLTDDLTFEVNGEPPAAVNGGLQRQGRYSWAAMIQRPQNDRPTTADLTILVYDNRAPFAIPAQDEVVVTAPVMVGSRSFQVSVPTRTPEQSPLVRRGGWIMDGTIGTVNVHQNPAPRTVAVRSANFYRVVGVTEVGVDMTAPGMTDYQLDVEPPIRPVRGTEAAGTTAFAAFADTGAPLQYPAQMYLVANLAEVFPRPQLTADDR